MQTPVQVEYQGMASSPKIQAAVEKQVAELEQRFGRVTSCRIVVKSPGNRQRTGGLYEIAVRLALPNGREVNVDRTAKEDERRADLSFAINDAFKRARRRLQDHARRMQGRVKEHEGPPIGTVTNLDPSGEFGFLESADGREIYFHRNSVLDGAFNRLAVGSQVTFAEEMGEKGPKATTVRQMGKHSLRV
jgi:cold shock CspA family protein/ribosome-associated translation inhibitor RaiA